ncbi:MAG: ATP-binding protein [Haloarculaceae archaeon]
MSYLLTEPDAVVVVGGAETDRERTASAVREATAGTVVTVATGDVEEVLASRDDVGCIVALDGDAEAIAAVHEAANRADPGGRLPVIAYVEMDEDVAAAAATREACRYLPRGAGEECLRDAVADALASYDRRRDEAARSDLFTTLLEDGKLSIFAKDDEGRHVYLSDNEDSVPPQEARGKTDVEIAPPVQLETAREAYEDDLAVIESGEPFFDDDVEYEYDDGNTFWVSTSKIPWRDDDGDVIGLVGYSKDATLRKQYERQLTHQADRIDQYVRYVTHDLRTPLQIAYGALDRLQAADGLDEDALDTLAGAVERIEGIVEGMNELTKGPTTSPMTSRTLSTLRAESLTTELVPLVEDIWSVIAPESAELRVELPEGTVVTADADVLRPVFENLLKNAVDHAGPGVTVRLGATDTNDLYVADDGPGIPEDQREKVTELGYTTERGDADAAGGDTGTGTGLDIVSRTVDRQGWELTITESESGGARFEIDGPPMVTRTQRDRDPAEPIPLESNEDVGPVSKPGSAEYDAEEDRWTVVANGENVWADVHEFHLVYGTGSPPVSIRGRISSLDGVDEFSKAGLTVRAGRSPEDPFGYVGVTEAHGSEVTWRLSRDGFTDSEQFVELLEEGLWYRIDYVDGLVTCYLSESRDRWVPVDQRSLDLGDPVTVGLSVCSHSRDRTCEATFADVQAWELDDDQP